jgi:Metallopeptidase family M24
MKLKMAPEDLETTFTPSIQSGGVYDLKPGVGSTADNLTPDIVIVSAGLRYRNYCGTITRTFFVNAPDAVSAAYNALLQAHTRALDALRSGTAVKVRLCCLSVLLLLVLQSHCAHRICAAAAALLGTWCGSATVKSCVASAHTVLSLMHLISPNNVLTRNSHALPCF